MPAKGGTYNNVTKKCDISCNSYISKFIYGAQLVAVAYQMTPPEDTENKTYLKAHQEFHETVSAVNCDSAYKQDPLAKKFVDDLPNYFNDKYENWTCPA